MRNTSQLRAVWAPPCSIRSHRLTFWTGVPVTIDARCAQAFEALDSILEAWRYRPLSGQTWGYNCRRITGGTGYSLHAYGIAVDINSLANPYGKRLITDMPGPMVAAAKAIRTNGGHRVFGWGGDYGGNKDAMHFEVVASPDELATGIDRSTVGGEAKTDAPPKLYVPKEDLPMASCVRLPAGGYRLLLDGDELQGALFEMSGPPELVGGTTVYPLAQSAQDELFVRNGKVRQKAGM